MGHVGMIMLIVKSGALTWLTRRLAAVGSMALSNYLTHSIVCTTLFYGYGFGLFGDDQPHRPGRHRAGDLGLSSSDQPDLAQAFPVRPGGMALAFAHLLEAPADAGVKVCFPPHDSQAVLPFPPLLQLGSLVAAHLV